MRANTLRLYTILPPTFYRALRAWNRAHPDRLLWLVHGVWTELPPDHDFEDSAWKGEFRQEMRRVVELIHGDADIPSRPGHAGGHYDADVSRWTLGYIIGREWEPFAVKEFEARFRGPSAGYQGQFLESAAQGLHVDAWMAEQCDYLVGYEVERYNTIRPIAYTNWPTLDPLTHPTESNAAEEAAWRRRVGRPTERDPIEYENDAIGLDAMLVRPTARNPAGWFASYHAYPYYPDFMLYDPGYDSARSSEGRSNYFGYLTELKRHHQGLPLLLSEYGVPSSRGVAHLEPQGWHHGGHDEVAMARIDARLTREIRESGAAGGIIFAWLDEWFKKNWLVIEYERPAENTRQWHNVEDAEQHYGVVAMVAGDGSATRRLGDSATRWEAMAILEETGQVRLRVGSDESYVHLAVEFPDLVGKSFPWSSQDVVIALDTYRADRGQRRLPGGVRATGVGFEFLATFRDTADAELRIVPGYSPYVGGDAIDSLGDDYGRFSRRPITSPLRDDGRFDSMFVITNRARFARDGRFIPASGSNRGRLVVREQHRIRWGAILHNVQTGGVEALPITGLLSFLLGIVIAYQGADQLQRIGANIFVADLVGISMLCELSPMMTAIIIAGRSGSAYRAQIGTMKMTEEIDALRTIGVPPLELLVLPKMIALVIVMPLLTVYTDVTGVLGGMIMAQWKLGVDMRAFLDRLDDAIVLSTYWTGLVKAPVFAMIVALVGCYRGFQVTGSAESVGTQTTMSVVQAIFLVIVTDAMFSIVFLWLEL